MGIEVGRIEAIFRYPVKSMRGEQLDTAPLGWHGIEGDRRFAFRRRDVTNDFPWLSASSLPELICFTPERHGVGADDAPTHVRSPDGEVMPLFSEALAADVGRRYGGPVAMMEMKHGVFDEPSISVIATETIAEICRIAGRASDVRRFRPNVLVHATNVVPFEEDRWVGGVLTFGDASDCPAVAITMRDVRCAMVKCAATKTSSDLAQARYPVALQRGSIKCCQCVRRRRLRTPPLPRCRARSESRECAARGRARARAG
jgi:uncharacterized protein YcbX